MKIMFCIAISLLVACSGSANKTKAEMAYQESREKMCNRFTVVVDGAAMAASQQIEQRYLPMLMERLITDLPMLIMISDGCIALPEAVLKASDAGGVKQAVLSLDNAMRTAKSKGWPLVQ